MTVYLCLMLAVVGVDKPSTPSSKAVEKLNAMHLADAEAWQMKLDDSGRDQAELVRKPVYIWTNPVRTNGQHGSVFIWLQGGRPVVIGSMFSHPTDGNRRMVYHEFHSLATGDLFAEKPSTDLRWLPKAPVERKLVPGAPTPDSSATRRLIQMRTISREFTSHGIYDKKDRWELRLLPQPMYRYEERPGDVVDGALFAFVTSAGTDPEVVLLLEALRTGSTTAWYYRAVRFSDQDLFVQHKGKEVWTSVRDDANQLFFNPDHTYELIRAATIDELPELISEK